MNSSSGSLSTGGMSSTTTATTTTTTFQTNNIPSFLSIPAPLFERQQLLQQQQQQQQQHIVQQQQQIVSILDCITLSEIIGRLLSDFKSIALLADNEFSELNNTYLFIKSSLVLYKSYTSDSFPSEGASPTPGQHLMITSKRVCYQMNVQRIHTLLSQLRGSLTELKSTPKEGQTTLITTILKTDSLLKQSVDQLLAMFTINNDQVIVCGNISNNNNNTGNGNGCDYDPLLLLPQDAAEMWKKKFGENVLLVPWPIFFDRTQSYINVRALKYEDNFKHIIDFTQDGYVSPFKLSTFLKWFGPLSRSFNNVVDTIDAKIMSGFISGVEASRFLERKSAGHYIIRFSKTYPGAFAVTFVEQSSNIRHCLLYPVATGLTLLQPPDIFPNLTGFVLNFSSKLKHAVGPVDPMMFPPSDNINPSASSLLVSPISDKHRRNNSSNSSNSSSGDRVPIISVQPQQGQQPQQQQQGQSDLEYNESVVTTPSGSPNVNFLNEVFLSRSPVRPQDATNTASTTGGTTEKKKKNRRRSKDVVENNLTDKDLCVVCMDKHINTVFLECGHLSCCSRCSEKLKNCPLCRKSITRVVTIFRVTS
ncbi:hypothetical protein SAMD00019534_070160 [Acytostelium subglobosum LB1]|uniref:hypothetical protein n=1 Tax=Acytostelium subglobosum LB1 TaxID=1410327 RepID=UPI000644C13E|nr:hypothetical protein SAMD00019534_070160 [Acytostelium subglobosum LB1]GAM23841.1 hypothetical protein SAMD00019534_070160 [Acytostelium subglobosum LB1]|eukprot:XP_012752877.1 hypothetical protein SAMD00019534_070160 [Acytostelium subglobosum LB1]